MTAKSIFPGMCSAIGLLLIGSLCCTPVIGDETSGDGIDVILLIDVSESMAELDPHTSLTSRFKNGGWTGSDPGRMRWDAVKLLVDLLDSHDRVLIQRFNENCPARFEGRDTPQVFPDGTPFKDPKQDFPRGFTRSGDERQWQSVIHHIEQFNHRLKSPIERKSEHDDAWTLDQGGTNIIAAIESLQSAVKDAPNRHKRLILLTDGCDQNIDDYITDPESDVAIVNDRLRDKISFLKESGIPVYTVGLNLKNIRDGKAIDANGTREMQSRYVKYGSAFKLESAPRPHYQRTKARAFLTAISGVTGGEFIEVDTATELLPIYQNLIYKFKGLWQKIEIVPARGVISIPISSAVTDFRMMAFVKSAVPTSAKATTRPPDFAERSGKWVPESAATGLAAPQLRQGTEEKLYAIWYGGNLNPDSREKPFALINDDVRWNVPIPNETHEVMTTQFKRIPEEFGWPPAMSTFYRHENAIVTLIAASDLLNAQDFEWTIVSSAGVTRPPGFAADEVTKKHMRAIFEAGKHVSVPWNKSTRSQQVTWKLNGVGTEPPRGRWPVLDGFHREFSHWNFQVKNELPLRFRENRNGLSLSLLTVRDTCEIETQFANPIEFIPMKVKFAPPKPEGSTESLPLKLFQLTQKTSGKSVPIALTPSGEGFFQLVSGAAQIELELANQAQNLPLDVEFTPGELMFLPADGELSERVELTKSVGLVIGRPPLQFFSDEKLIEQVAAIGVQPKANEEISNTVFVSPSGPSAGTDIRLELQWLTKPRGPDGKELPYTEDKPDGTNLRGEFSIRDLRESPELERSGDAWILKYSGKPVPIALVTSLNPKMPDRQAESIAEANLIASGKGFSKGALKMSWKFQSREVKFRLLESNVSEVEPGDKVTIGIAGKVIAHRDDLQVEATSQIRKNGLKFSRIDAGESQDSFFPLDLVLPPFKATGSSKSTEAITMFSFQVPETVKPGRYEARLSFDEFVTVDGQKKPIHVKELMIELVIDRLLVEIYDPQTAKWIPATRRGIGRTEYPVYHKLGSPITLGLRFSSVLDSMSGIGFSSLERRYPLMTDSGRHAAADLKVDPAVMAAGAIPEWKITIPQLNNRDKNFPYVAEINVDRHKKLSQTLRLKLRLLKN